jgi:crossover junction endodeoxyribonuclease RusA
MITINLPPPPSANNLFLNIHGRGRVISPKYREWKVEAGWRLKQQRPEKIKGPVVIDIVHQDIGKTDGDNTLKPLFDLLVDHQVIEADTRPIVRRFSFGWEDVVGVRVTISPAS